MIGLRKLTSEELGAVFGGGGPSAQFGDSGGYSYMYCPTGYSIETNSNWSKTDTSTWTNPTSYDCNTGTGPNAAYWNGNLSWEGYTYYYG